MSSEGTQAGMCAEHYFASENVPNSPIWARRCSLCGAYDSDDMNKQLNDLINQEVLKALDTLSNHRNVVYWGDGSPSDMDAIIVGVRSKYQGTNDKGEGKS